MARLEYRLLDEAAGYPLLYYYQDLTEGEIALRMACSRFVKEGRAFEKTSAASELLQYVIYLQSASVLRRTQWPAADERTWLELRQWPAQEDEEAELLERLPATETQRLQVKLLCDYLQWRGQERLVRHVELDEDRCCYVQYLAAEGAADANGTSDD